MKIFQKIWMKLKWQMYPHLQWLQKILVSYEYSNTYPKIRFDWHNTSKINRKKTMLCRYSFQKIYILNKQNVKGRRAFDEKEARKQRLEKDTKNNWDGPEKKQDINKKRKLHQKRIRKLKVTQNKRMFQNLKTPKKKTIVCWILKMWCSKLIVGI